MGDAAAGLRRHEAAVPQIRVDEIGNLARKDLDPAIGDRLELEIIGELLELGAKL